MPCTVVTRGDGIDKRVGQNCLQTGNMGTLSHKTGLIESRLRMTDQPPIFSYFRGTKEPAFATRTEFEAARILYGLMSAGLLEFAEPLTEAEADQMYGAS